MLDTLDRLIERVHALARYGVWFGGGLILLAAFVVSFDVAIRKLFNVSLGGADEFSGFALAIGSAWAFGFALLERGHVRIDSIYTILPRPVCAALDILGLTVFGLFMFVMAWQGTGVFAESVRNSTVTLSAISWPRRYPTLLWVARRWWSVAPGRGCSFASGRGLHLTGPQGSSRSGPRCRGPGHGWGWWGSRRPP